MPKTCQNYSEKNGFFGAKKLVMHVDCVELFIQSQNHFYLHQNSGCNDDNNKYLINNKYPDVGDSFFNHFQNSVAFLAILWLICIHFYD